MNVNELPEHLGGHLDRTHVDQGAFDFITTKYSIASMIDIGCGPGGMYHLAKTADIDWRGIDGDYTLKHPEEIKPLVTIHDFANIGNSGKDTRIAILELLLVTLNAVIVKE